MKRLGLGTIFAIFFFVGTYLVFGIYRNHTLSANVESGSYNSCFQSSVTNQYKLLTWLPSEVFDIRFAPSGSELCFAPKFPSISVSSSKVTHWLHIVRTSGDKQFTGKHASIADANWNWAFVDVGSQEMRDNSYPFYSVGGVFRDNPSWSAAPHITLTWNGELYGLVKIGETFYPVGGLTWGFKLNSWSLTPVAITPLTLKKDSWQTISQLLSKEYPDYKFASN